MRAWLVAAVCFGCGAKAGPRVAPDGALAAGSARPVTSERPRPAAPASSPAASPIRLEPEVGSVAQEPGTRIEFLSPVFGETLSQIGVRRHELRIAFDPTAVGPGRAIAVSFDGLRPRVLGAETALVLGDLVPEDRAIAPGPHWLLAVVTDGDGRAVVPASAAAKSRFALIDFFVGERAGTLPSPDAPRLICLSPVGTIHGALTERPALQLFPIGNVDSTIPLQLRAGQLRLETTVDPRRPYRIIGLPPGDVWIEVGAPGGPRAECVATLNPERKEGS
jgi:hypothetical protein